jgi:hypothetical protein
MSIANWFERNFILPHPELVREAEEAGIELRAKPRLAAVNQAPSREEFAAWRDDPVTRFVMGALNRNAEECREEWLRLSWESGTADQRKLDGLRERSDALLGFTADYEAFCETLGLEEVEDAA